MEEDKTLQQQQDGAGVALPAADAGAEARAAALQTLSQISYSESLTHRQVREAINSNSTKANANFEGLDAEIKDAAPYNEVEIDLTGMDEGTWYPVVIDVYDAVYFTVPPKCSVMRFKVSTRLGKSGVPSWCTHNRGFSVDLIWTDGQVFYGVNTATRTIEYYEEKFTTGGPCVGGLNRMGQAGMEFFYARGGGKYNVRVEGCDASITAYDEPFTVSGDTVAPVTTAPARPKKLLTEEEKAKYDQAATDASTADAKATTAQNTANAANSKATNAQTAAQTAVSQSATAKSAADAAAAAAADALAAVDGFVKNVLTFGEVTSGTYSPGSGELSFTSVKAQAGDSVTFCAIINNGGQRRGGGTFLLRRGSQRYINWTEGAGIEASTGYNAVEADVTQGTFTTRAGIVEGRVFISSLTAQIVVCAPRTSDGYIIK